MADAPRDGNHITTVLLESSTNPGVVFPAKGDQVTGRLLTDSAAGSGTVTSVSVVTANGVSGSVATATTTPAITLTLGAITPTTVNGLTITANGTNTLSITAGKTLSIVKTMSFTAADDTGVYTLPTGTKTLLATDGSGASLSNVVNSITGTANQVIASAATGAVTLSLPQSIGTSSNPQFATLELGAASDTTLARVSAGVISVEGVRVITSSGTTSGTILKNNGTTFVASTETYATPGTSGNVMTSDGNNWTSAAPAATSSPTMILSTDFAASGRYTDTLTGSGAGVYGNGGKTVDTGGSGSAQTTWQIGAGAGDLYGGSPTFSCRVTLAIIGTDVDSFFGVGACTVATAGITYTVAHAGFKIVRTSSGTIDLKGTVANGVSESATASLTTVAANDELDLIMVVNSTTSVDFYWSKNSGTRSSKTSLSGGANIPSTVNQYIQFAISSHNVNTRSLGYVSGATFQR